MFFVPVKPVCVVTIRVDVKGYFATDKWTHTYGETDGQTT